MYGQELGAFDRLAAASTNITGHAWVGESMKKESSKKAPKRRVLENRKDLNSVPRLLGSRWCCQTQPQHGLIEGRGPSEISSFLRHGQACSSSGSSPERKTRSACLPSYRPSTGLARWTHVAVSALLPVQAPRRLPEPGAGAAVSSEHSNPSVSGRTLS